MIFFPCVPHPLCYDIFQLGKIDEQIKMERYLCHVVISSNKFQLRMIHMFTYENNKK
jgi:hypothetical protein